MKTNITMDRKEELKKLVALKKEELAPLEAELREIYNNEEKQTEDRIKLAHRVQGNFEEAELVFAAKNRCQCGAGLAHPNGIGIHGSWHCSAILLGKADVEVKHTEGYPFSFYNIKSEGQPSAEGATTRTQ